MVAKKDTRISTGRVATYAQKMKAAGHKQFSFFLSPQAYEALKNLTISEKKLGATMGGTVHNLLNLLHSKEFIYLSIFRETEVSAEEREAAIIKTMQYLQSELVSVKNDIEAQQRQMDMITEGIEPYPQEASSDDFIIGN